MTGRGHRAALAGALALLALPPAVAAVDWLDFERAHRPAGTFVSSGESREYRLHVPPDLPRGQAVPLVISLHGGGLSGAVQELMSQWDPVADREGFIVAYPSGAGGRGPRAWHADSHRRSVARDVRFIAELIDTLRAHYAIDSTRVYVDGLSNGGGMAFVVSCALADRVAAVGMVASAQMFAWRDCTDRRPVPAMIIHGTSDAFAPYLGGRSRRMDIAFPNIPVFVRTFARRNGCASEPVVRSPERDVARIEYVGCTADASVVHYRLEGGGHLWPGGEGQSAAWVGTAPAGFDASRVLWAFYTLHRLGANAR